MSLTEREEERYKRHLLIDGFGEDAQMKLKSARVLVIGAGGLGCPVLQYLVAAGVGKIGIVDADVVSLSNLQRQILYTSDEIGQSKSDIAARKLKGLNNEIEIVSYPFFLDEDNIEILFSDYDLVVGATDNFESRYLIDHYCEKLGLTFVHGSILEFEGQISIFAPDQGLRYKDLFSEADNQSDLSLGVMGTLPGIIGSMMASETVKVICGFGEPLIGKLLLYDAKMNTQSILELNGF